MGGDHHPRAGDVDAGISIHAPRMGGDSFTTYAQHSDVVFQSTPPAWGATELAGVVVLIQRISIHAPRMGGD